MTWRYTLIDKILIIDDEIIFCNALRNHLIQKGYHVKIYTSFNEFQGELGFGQFDLVLLDLNLPDIYGLDLFKSFKKTNPRMKVIIISAYLDHENITEAKKLGAYECVSKNTQMFQVLDQIFETM